MAALKRLIQKQLNFPKVLNDIIIDYTCKLPFIHDIHNIKKRQYRLKRVDHNISEINDALFIIKGNYTIGLIMHTPKYTLITPIIGLLNKGIDEKYLWIYMMFNKSKTENQFIFVRNSNTINYKWDKS